MQPDDATPRAAAERETLEETGVDLIRHGRFQARLSDLITRQHSRWRPMVVTPYVYEWRGPQAVSPNREVKQMVWISLTAANSWPPEQPAATRPYTDFICR